MQQLFTSAPHPAKPLFQFPLRATFHYFHNNGKAAAAAGETFLRKTWGTKNEVSSSLPILPQVIALLLKGLADAILSLVLCD
jgi:hypothetical protein